MPSRRTLVVIAACALAGPAACVKADLVGLSTPIPAGSVVYRMVDAAIAYHFTDTSSNRSFELWWEAQRGFEGFNCIGLLPKSVSDTTGTFVFAWEGRNVGVLKQRTGTDTTFVQGYFLPVPPLGTSGTYVLNSAGHLTLTWADGTPTQYFDPKADIRLAADTISSHAELSALADSVHASWQVRWVRSVCQ